MPETTNSVKPQFKLQPAAVKILRKIQKKIETAPTSFDMSVLIAKQKKGRVEALIPLVENLLPPCGTTACIAGWTLLFANKPRGTLRTAAKLLGLQDRDGDMGEWFEASQADTLFISEQWPQPFLDRDQDLQAILGELYDDRVDAEGNEKSTLAIDKKIASAIKKRGALAIKRIEHLITKGI